MCEYVINVLNVCYWYDLVKCYVDELNVGKDGLCGDNFNMCWIVLMVVDVYWILNCGGIFMYLVDKCMFDCLGKLCLMYEVNLMLFIVE